MFPEERIAETDTSTAENLMWVQTIRRLAALVSRMHGVETRINILTENGDIRTHFRNARVLQHQEIYHCELPGYWVK